MLRSFYRNWGWSETATSTDVWCAFDMGGCLLSLYPIDLLRDEAAPNDPTPNEVWRGFTLAINVQSEDRLRGVFEAALEAGATSVAAPTNRGWGGASGYVADPEGNRWELATGGPNPAPT